MPYQDPTGVWHSDDGAYVWDGAAWHPAPPPRKTGPPVAVMVLAMGCAALVLLALLGAGAAAFVAVRRTPSTPPPVAAPRARCQPAEQLDVHYHTHLTVIVNGAQVPIPANTGIEEFCLYWLHMHDTSGIIHIETPASQGATTFTLADFYAVMRQPIGPHQVGDVALGPGEQVRTWTQLSFDAPVKRWSGSPAAVPLRNCEAITIEIGPAPTAPPPFTWPKGFLCDPGSTA